MIHNCLTHNFLTNPGNFVVTNDYCLHHEGGYQQPLDLPSGTHQHFSRPGGSGETLGANPSLLGVGPPLGGFNSIDGGDHGSPHTSHHEKQFGNADLGNSVDFKHHHEGLIPHESFGVHHEKQYGSSPSGFSDISFGDFGPVKDDDLLNSGKQHVKESFTIDHSETASPHSSVSFGSVHESSIYEEPHSHADVSFGNHHETIHYGSSHDHDLGGHALGSIPYSHSSSPSYGPPTKFYGPPLKPYAGTPYVIPLRNNRYHGKGKRGKKGGGYLKKFMGMLG